MFWLGRYTYKSKQELQEKLKAYLMAAHVGEVRNRNADRKLRLLLMMHPDAARKIGSGIDYFTVVRNARGAGQGFHVVRTDGTVESFSYKRCISGVMQSDYGKVREALRFAVQPQLMEEREKHKLPVICKLSDVAIRDRKELHMDHVIPFCQLLEDFSIAQNVDLSALKTIGNGEALHFVDSEVTASFVRYHRQHAKLQPTSRIANAAKGGRLAGGNSSMRAAPVNPRTRSGRHECTGCEISLFDRGPAAAGAAICASKADGFATFRLSRLWQSQSARHC
ncbi:DCL family protein [Pseudomonas amygdali]|uniref:DCL family protein n=1 Tax=Pseudomonas amygdali TaxID=47877 RepID=UPI001C57C98B|nr:DCL family protein [Pseudomonas amygdali]QXW42687.1 DCL family protein [Pseudomonas amygdali]